MGQLRHSRNSLMDKAHNRPSASIFSSPDSVIGKQTCASEICQISNYTDICLPFLTISLPPIKPPSSSVLHTRWISSCPSPPPLPLSRFCWLSSSSVSLPLLSTRVVLVVLTLLYYSLFLTINPSFFYNFYSFLFISHTGPLCSFEPGSLCVSSMPATVPG